jgi:hypothetical protein
MILEILFWLSISHRSSSDPLRFFPGCQPLPAVEEGPVIEPLQAQPLQQWNTDQIIRA